MERVAFLKGLPSSGVSGGVHKSELDRWGMLHAAVVGLRKLENVEDGEEDCEVKELEEIEDAGLPVTQSDDPRSGGHFTLGVSKTPLFRGQMSQGKKISRTYPRPSRERSRVIVHVLGALEVAHSEHARLVVEGESPISNGLTTVAEIWSAQRAPERTGHTWGKD